MKILCIGHSAYDITMQANEYPKENVKYRTTNKVECGGGPAANAAYLLTKWGINDTYYMGAIGNDIYGKRIIEEFIENKMNLDYIKAIPNVETPLSFIIANANNGNRNIFTYNDKKLKYDCSDVNFPNDVDIILTDGHEFETTLKAIENNKDAKVIIDAGKITENNITLSKIADYVVCSQDFAEGYTNKKIIINNKSNLEEIFNDLEEDFKNVIIITLGEIGSVYKENGKIKIIDALKTKAIDSTAAGDIYHGAFTFSIANNYSIEKSIKIANIAGSLSVSKLGGKASMPNLNDVMEYYDKYN